MDAVLIQFQTPSKAALFGDLKALLEAAGMGGFLPASPGQMINPWLRVGYRLDWHFFRVTRMLVEATGETLAVTVDRGLHCDVLVTRVNPWVVPVATKLRTLRDRVRDLPEIDHDSPQSVLTRWGAAQARVRRALGGSTVLQEVLRPYHAFLGVPLTP